MAKILQFFIIFLMTFFFLCNSSSSHENLIAIDGSNESASSELIFENYNDLRRRRMERCPCYPCCAYPCPCTS